MARGTGLALLLLILVNTTPMMLAVFLDNYGIAVRTGHHCAMPLMAYYNVPAMCRASLAMYNTHEEVDRLVTGLQRIHRLLG